jgi:hypothetical protein
VRENVLMRVVQIVGPSYSGSTMLGYVLNVLPGHFFGSEVYRLLPEHRRTARQPGPDTCLFCGPGCPYWTPALRAAVQGDPAATLTDLYRRFAGAHTDVEVFVDGTKALRWYDGHWQGRQVVSAKHPVRLVCSDLYNRSELLGLPQNTSFADFRAETVRRPSAFGQRARQVLDELLREYRQILAAAPEAHVSRLDQLTVDDLAEFGALCGHIGVVPDAAALRDFTAYEIHPIGGNKAPFWQRRTRVPQASADQARETGLDRHRFYTADRSTGDYKVDDKYRDLLSESVLRRITKQPAYGRLCDLLGYPREVEAAAADVSGY